MLKHNSYNVINEPNLTYQKANAIVKGYILEDGNRINQLKYKIAEKFNLIHYIYSFLYAKIHNTTNSFGIERKNDFGFQFQMWRKEKQQKFIAKELIEKLKKKNRHRQMKIKLTIKKLN